MIKWHFIPQPACFVETGVTQRDQFRNDEVDLYETIVRESIQNSLDATPAGKSTRVSFKWVNKSLGLESSYLSNLFEEQLAHAECSGLDLSQTDFNQPTALVIEDFGTSGLTGSTHQKDDDNFSDFWRRHGKSHKTGTSRGRWGLGKLVYSSCSSIGAFLGLTVRASDDQAYLMGQTVLDLRRCEGLEYPAHAYWSEMHGDDMNTWVPVPSSDSQVIDRFKNQFSVSRKHEPGLSIVIPFPNPAIQPDDVIGVCIANYFYPVLTGQLTVEVNGQEIKKSNIRSLAHSHARGKITDIDPLFDFIEEANQSIESGNLITLKESWIDDVKLDADDFEPEDVEKIRAAFSEGNLVGVRLPLTIHRKKPSREEIPTEFFVFVKRPENLAHGLDLYVRGGLTLPAESKFGERKAFGAMIANDEAISAFLGDAENPAHTKWIFNAEKLRNNYVSPMDRLKVIKKSVLNFYDMLVQTEEEEDEKALISFFFTDLPEESGKKSRRKPGVSPVKPVEPIEPKPRIAVIENSDGGFSVIPSTVAAEFEYPQIFRIKAAYDIPSGNPFKNWHPLDFNFRKKTINPAATKESVELLEVRENEYVFRINNPEFRIRIDGFDSNRDLVVKLDNRLQE